MNVSRNAVGRSISLLALASALACAGDGPSEPRYAFLYVKALTSGSDRDENYELIVGNERRGLVGNATVVMSITPGTYTVELSGVAPNCSVDGGNSRTIEIGNKDSQTLQFAVTCLIAGFQINVHTVGDDTPPTYILRSTAQPSLSLPLAGALPVNGSMIISRLAPGPYTLEIDNRIPSCTPDGSARIETAVTVGSLTPVSFEIRCTPPVRLEKIAYVIDGAAQATSPVIALSNPDGSNESPILAGQFPVWSPDGKKLAYAGTGCDAFYDYYCYDYLIVRDPETGRDRFLAYTNAKVLAAWSPSGDRIVYAVPGPGQLFVIGADGGSAREIPLPAGVRASDAAWSPDGEWITYSCFVGDILTQLCKSHPDGSSFTQLSTGGDAKTHPAWSHDGASIAYTIVNPSGSSIGLMATSDGTVTVLTDGFDPAWSRDGAKLIFARSDGLFTINRDGSGLTRLTTGRHHAPSWRP